QPRAHLHGDARVHRREHRRASPIAACRRRGLRAHWQARRRPGYLDRRRRVPSVNKRAGWRMSTTTKYTTEHEWMRIESDDSVTVGITDDAREQLVDIVYVQLPDVGRRFKKGEEAVVIESVKSAADIKMPIAGDILAVNTKLTDAPETVNY